MWRSVAMMKLVSQLELVGAQNLSYCTITQGRNAGLNNGSRRMLSDGDDGSNGNAMSNNLGKDIKHRIGKNVPKKDRLSFLVNTLLHVQDSKEAVYGTLDSWAAWEREFPIGHLKQVLITLQKEQQWHRVVQVIKWMLSKGQGTTMNTYGQLIRALDMDHRVKEAHAIWVEKVGHDMHSVPWNLCKLMIGVYYRNNMLDNLVKLSKSMEAYDRKIYQKSVLMKIADSYETLGLVEEKDRVLKKYSDLIDETSRKHTKKSQGTPSKKNHKNHSQ
ncbi:pentatricopeptide repeat-containing protein At4g18975, chloroplastic-like isoform X1 [Apium graveolens]|uniref:pentatricopeptide repeat-containing protein At4g18975, chloroplastic-like isoform X1 n=1 Tax=Apium graveolens TaxID=4045 RepID=UPI003D7A59DC